jgi:hypothetical protein
MCNKEKYFHHSMGQREEFCPCKEESSFLSKKKKIESLKQYLEKLEEKSEDIKEYIKEIETAR